MSKFLLVLGSILTSVSCFAEEVAVAAPVWYEDIIIKVIDFILSLEKVSPVAAKIAVIAGVIGVFMTCVSLFLSGVNTALKAANKGENEVVAKIIFWVDKINYFIKYVSLRNAK